MLYLKQIGFIAAFSMVSPLSALAQMVEVKEFTLSTRSNESMVSLKKDDTNFSVKTFTVTIKNNSSFRINCKVSFRGYSGTLGGYIVEQDDLNLLIDANSERSTGQPQQLLMTSEDAISAKCFKFAFQ